MGVELRMIDVIRLTECRAGVTLSAVAFSWLAFGCAKPDAAPSQAQTVTPALHLETFEVVEKAVPKTSLLVGSLVAQTVVDLAAKVDGPVSRTFVERGAEVERGAALVQIDESRLALLAREASAGASVARVRERSGGVECERATQLFERAAVSRAELERQQAECEQAVAFATAASARAHLAGKDVADSIVRAPFRGAIVERYVDIGEYVRVGTPVVKLAQRWPLRVSLRVPSADAPRVHVGQEIDFTLPGLKDKRFMAKITFIAPLLDPRDRALPIEAEVTRDDSVLTPGMFVTARLTMGSERALIVPRSALRVDEAGTRVFVVEAGHARERIVLTEERDPGFAVVRRGLASGSRVIAEPPSDLHDGSKVE